MAGFKYEPAAVTSIASSFRKHGVGKHGVRRGKIPILQEVLADSGFDSSEVAYIGDDFTDVVIMRRVGFAVATANARPEVKAAAHYVTVRSGGDGAVREVVELILKAQNLWVDFLRHYEIC